MELKLRSRNFEVNSLVIHPDRYYSKRIPGLHGGIQWRNGIHGPGMCHDRFWNFAKLSRRGAVRLIAALAVRDGSPLSAWAPPDLEVDRVWPAAGDPVEPAAESLYRVDATILLLSVPVLRRTSVGEARLA